MKITINKGEGPGHPFRGNQYGGGKGSGGSIRKLTGKGRNESLAKGYISTDRNNPGLGKKYLAEHPEDAAYKDVAYTEDGHFKIGNKGLLTGSAGTSGRTSFAGHKGNRKATLWQNKKGQFEVRSILMSAGHMIGGELKKSTLHSDVQKAINEAEEWLES